MATEVQADLRELAKAKRLQRKMLLDEIAEKQEEVEHVEASLARIRSMSKLAARAGARPGHADAAVEQVVGGGRVAVVGGPVPVDSPQWTGPHDRKAVGLPFHHDGKLGAIQLGEGGAGGGVPVADGIWGRVS